METLLNQITPTMILSEDDVPPRCLRSECERSPGRPPIAGSTDGSRLVYTPKI